MPVFPTQTEGTPGHVRHLQQSFTVTLCQDIVIAPRGDSPRAAFRVFVVKTPRLRNDPPGNFTIGERPTQLI